MITNFFVFFAKACFHKEWTYRVLHRFGQAKFANGGLVLGSSQFAILPQVPLKTMFGLKVVKIDSKLIISINLLI
jgi:hypothetical protein